MAARNASSAGRAAPLGAGRGGAASAGRRSCGVVHAASSSRPNQQLSHVVVSSGSGANVMCARLAGNHTHDASAALHQHRPRRDGAAGAARRRARPRRGRAALRARRRRRHHRASPRRPPPHPGRRHRRASPQPSRRCSTSRWPAPPKCSRSPSACGRIRSRSSPSGARRSRPRAGSRSRPLAPTAATALERLSECRHPHEPVHRPRPRQRDALARARRRRGRAAHRAVRARPRARSRPRRAS